MDVTAPGRELHERFLKLGNMTGKTSTEIIDAVGQPSSISSLGTGKTLLQWQATGCHMAVLFDADDKFVKITHQYARYAPARSGCVSSVMMILGTLLALVLLFLRVLR
jgi:hypothetical protein